MNRQTIEYKLYQMILESNLSDEERSALLEANILQRAGDWFSGVSDWFGAAKDWVNSPLGTLFSDAKLGRRMQTSIGNVKKEIEQLKKIAKEGGKNEKEVIAAFLKGVLNSENMSAGDLTKSSGGPGPKAGNIPAEELPAGTKVTTADPQVLLSALTQLLANITGKPIETVAKQANEKKIDATTMTSVVAKQAAQKTGIDAKTVQNVVNALIKTGHLVMENANKQTQNVVLTERWQKLAGINGSLLAEAGNVVYQALRDRINRGEIKTQEQLENDPKYKDAVEKNQLRPSDVTKLSDALAKQAGKSAASTPDLAGAPDESTTKAAVNAANEMSDTSEELKKKVDQLTKSNKFSNDMLDSTFKTIIKMLDMQRTEMNKYNPSLAASYGQDIEKLSNSKASPSSLSAAIALNDKLSGQIAQDLQNVKFNKQLSDDKLKSQIDNMTKGQEELGRILDNLSSKKGELEQQLSTKNVEAAQLASQLEKSKQDSEEFIADLASSLKIEPENLKTQIGEKGLKAVIAAAMQKAPDAVSAAATAAGVSTQSAVGGAQQQKKAEVALKKFSTAADSVRKEVKDIDDTTLGTILNYFDELEDIKIA